MKILSFKKNNSQRGISLLELIVAIGIFSIVVLLANGIYINIISSQRQSISAQTTQEALRFAFEMISKEIRSAQGAFDGSECGSTSPTPGYYKVFNNSTNDLEDGDTIKLYFKNKNNECMLYERVVDANGYGKLKISRGIEAGFITPDELDIKDLRFIIRDQRSGVVGTVQPSVTIMMEAEMINGPKQNIRMQTTITSREYTY